MPRFTGNRDQAGRQSGALALEIDQQSCGVPWQQDGNDEQDTGEQYDRTKN
jgi:hypothetical protein